jgi:hypothetical protein
MKHFKEYLASKAKEGQSKMDPKESKAKMEMLDHLSGLMKDHMSNGLKKVTVASDSKEGLEKGLEKAKEVVDKAPMESEEASEDESCDESPMEESSEEDNMSPEELDQLIAHLQEKRSKLA